MKATGKQIALCLEQRTGTHLRMPTEAARGRGDARPIQGGKAGVLPVQHMHSLCEHAHAQPHRKNNFQPLTWWQKITHGQIVFSWSAIFYSSNGKPRVQLYYDW